MRILWPNMPAEFHDIAREAVGPGFITEFCTDFAQVTDEQWANADAIVGPSPPAEHIGKLKKCRIFVKSAVGYDEVDVARYGAMGIAVSNTPDYGTREVADHAIALMKTLTKSIAFHDRAAIGARRSTPTGAGFRPAPSGWWVSGGSARPRRGGRRRSIWMWCSMIRMCPTATSWRSACGGLIRWLR